MLRPGAGQLKGHRAQAPRAACQTVGGTPSSEAKQWSLSDLLAAELLQPGQVLLPIGSTYVASASLGEDGTLEVGGEIFTSPSSAAVSVTQSPRNGWDFWCVTGDGEKIPLATLREKLGAEA